MKDLIGSVLLIVGVLGIVTLLGMAVYSAFGWIGVALMICVISFLCGMAILDGD